MYLIFDRYIPFSTISNTIFDRKTQASRVHQLPAGMQLPQQKVVLNVTENKRQLISIICNELITNTTFHENYTHTHKLTITGEEAIPVEIKQN